MSSGCQNQETIRCQSVSEYIKKEDIMKLLFSRIYIFIDMQTSNLQPLCFKTAKKWESLFCLPKTLTLDRSAVIQAMFISLTHKGHSEGCSCITKVRTLKWLLEVWKQPADNREALTHRCLNSQSIKNLILHCYPPQASAKWNRCCGERNGMNTHSLVKNSNCLTQALSLFPFLQGRLHLTDILW